MCGICGVFSSNSIEPVADIAARMNFALQHRGPDGQGQFTGDTCSIAMRRLAIIDLNTGNQPIYNESKSMVIVFNGEIYNYAELRRQLEASGRHTFTSHSDTEVIVHLYEEYGRDTPRYLHGMFAFCIYDTRDKSLFIARDRFGEKPVYYSVIEGAFGFSSELASLLEWKAVERKIDLEALFYYLHHEFVPSPLTMFANVWQLPSGSSLRWRNGRVEIERYFEPDYRVNRALTDEAAATIAVREALTKSVKSQMISDVPLGAFLSGGIDSSSVVAAMAHSSAEPVNTFTVRFEHAPYDESNIARAVSQHLGTNHHEITISNAAFQEEDLWRIVTHVGQPFADSSAIPTYLISKYVRDYVTVCLSGDGGDEMFAGYNYFRWNLTADRVARMVPKPVLETTYRASKYLSELSPLTRFDQLRQIRRASQLAGMSHDARLSELGAIYDQEDLKVITRPAIQASWAQQKDSRLTELTSATGSLSRLRQMMAYRLKYSLPEDMLVKVDRMSMASSLEVRAPMLGVELAELSMQLPDDLLVRNGVSKYILREATRDWLPPEVFSHPKTGFSIPLHMFQNETYRRLCMDLILSATDLMQELFDTASLERYVMRGLDRKTNASDVSVFRAGHQVWSLLQLGAWANKFGVIL